MWEYIAISALSSSIGALVTYGIVKNTFSDDAILEKIQVITDEIMKNTEMQQKMYAIGSLIGSGIASGTGLQKKGGKFGLQELIMQIAGQWIGQKMGVAGESGERKPLISLNP